MTLALNEIKELKDQMNKKNQHIEEFVNIVNKLEEENSQLEEIILILRYDNFTKKSIIINVAIVKLPFSKL